MYHEYFPETFIQLQKEIEHHPLLVQRLQKHQGLGIEVIFAETCHYCGVAINAELDGEQLEALASQLIKMLQVKPIKDAIKDLSLDWTQEAWKFGVH